jgi:hypothetical protein
MDSMHRLVFNARKNGSELELLAELRLKYRFDNISAYPNASDALGLVSVELSESNPVWPIVFKASRGWNAIEQITTKFTQSEFRNASHLNVVSSWHYSYPMPDDDSGYLAITYDANSGCSKCGIGLQQKSPFRMKGEPKWGRNQILQLNWVFDEFFVTPEAYESVFKPFGIESREVINHKSERPLESILQLATDSLPNVPLVIDRPVDEYCSQCGQGKFNMHNKGFFPKLERKTNGNIVRSCEFFGSGGSAWRALIVSDKVYQAISAFNLKGIRFVPLAR